MANTSLSLGDHWEVFIKEQVNTGRYGSASELIRDSLIKRKARLKAGLND